MAPRAVCGEGLAEVREKTGLLDAAVAGCCVVGVKHVLPSPFAGCEDVAVLLFGEVEPERGSQGSAFVCVDYHL